MNYIKQLFELNSSDLLIAGGKAANLGAMIGARLPAPGGFCVLTDAYIEYVRINGLEQKINQIISATKNDDILSLENASEQIRYLFLSYKVPNIIIEEIRIAYADLDDKCISGQHNHISVAVRSSATLEDLAEMSFAGQQDTYLNIKGSDALLESIIRCWASLWTARAIGYRMRNGIPQTDIALAVVVQQMVQSDVSGVLFTANPLTGKRTEIVIDATFGLGEALVSGLVEPDHYVCEAKSGAILHKTIGEKAISIQSQSGGGTITVTENTRGNQALDDEKIIELAKLGWRTADYFKCPQDIEWAMTDGKFYLIQSRPITSLYPLPLNLEESNSNESLKLWFSFGSWQGMLEPYTPLGQDMMTGFAEKIGKKLGFDMDDKKQNFFVSAGERLFVDLTPFTTSTIGRKLIIEKILPEIEPAISKPIEELVDDSRFSSHNRFISLRQFLRIGSFLIPFAVNTFRNIANPQKGRQRIYKTINNAINELEMKVRNAHTTDEYLQALEDCIQYAIVHIFPCIVPAVISGQIPLQIVKRICSDLPGGLNLVMDLTRGLSYDVTMEMDLSLWHITNEIRKDSDSFGYFIENDENTLAKEYLADNLPLIAQGSIADFMASYGMRGVAEIDIGRIRWREEPENIMRLLKGYLKIKNSDMSPEAVLLKGAEAAKMAETQLIDALKFSKGGSGKARVVKFMTRRIRELGGLRELPKFTVMQVFAIFREIFMKCGFQMMASGILNRPDDIFFLHVNEITTLPLMGNLDMQALITQRKHTYEKEKRRNNIPRILLSDGTAFYGGITAEIPAEDHVITGSPVSAGVVEGIVRIVTNPYEAQLAYGEIMVCPATDPAWTPLFLIAAGLVMEVGGLSTHGSVVAREYGIPAVVGVSKATTRLRDGQKIRLDGSSGKIYLIEE